MNQPFVPRVLRPRRAAPADALRPTRAEVDLEALRHNLHVVRKHAGGALVWAVLKADGYGHGAPAVARTLERAKIDGFCVALVEEGIELRQAGIVAPILVMGGHYEGAHEEAIARGHDDIESLKRYTGFGTGWCQGKWCVALCARLLVERGGSASLPQARQVPSVHTAVAINPVIAPAER